MPRRPSRPTYPALDLGPLPVEIINAVLGTDLDAGGVHLSPRAHQHIAEDHPDDYAVCIAHLRVTIETPTFIGQAPRQTENFELIRRTRNPDGRAVLVAIGLRRDDGARYRVRSCYLVSAETIDQRRRAGRLKPPSPR